jgi:hypothetical protein
LLWKSTVFIARKSLLAFMRMWGYYAILTTFLLVFTCGMKSPKTSFVFGFMNVCICCVVKIWKISQYLGCLWRVFFKYLALSLNICYHTSLHLLICFLIKLG